MITAELTIIPIGTSGTSLSKYVAAAVSAIEQTEIKYELTGMGTLLECDDIEELFKAIKEAHRAVFNAGADRVATSVKIDERKDVEKTIQDKISSVEDKI